MGKFQFYSVRVLEVDRIVAFRVSGIFLRPPIEDRDVLWLQILFVELVYGLPRVCVKSNMVYANALPMIRVEQIFPCTDLSKNCTLVCPSQLLLLRERFLDMIDCTLHRQ